MDNFEILEDNDFFVAEILNKLKLDRSGSKEAKAKNIEILIDNQWCRIGKYLFYTSSEKPGIKNIWINANTGIEAEQEIIKQEVTKHYMNEGYEQYNGGNLLYKWDYNNYYPIKLWINSNTGLPPLVSPVEPREECIYNLYKDDSPTDVKLRQRSNNKYEFISINSFASTNNICNKIYNFLKWWF